LTFYYSIAREYAKELEEKGKQYGFQAIGFGCLGAPKSVYVYDQVVKRAINEKAQQSVFMTFDIYTLEKYRIQR
jgi:hypothetical protein